LITPLLDPVVASKIVFTKTLQELENYVDEDSLPIIITNNTNKPAIDDLEMERQPKAGNASTDTNNSQVKQYLDMIKNYEKKTREWVNSSNDCSQDALDRLKLGQHYRVTRVKAEKIIRGETKYHVKGLMNINEHNRLVINYNTKTWDAKDITDWV
jgi:hypothetical protein